MAFTLTIQQRYDLMFYISRLPCSVSLRYALSAFEDIIDFTPEEMKTKQITLDKQSFTISSNDPTYTITVESLPDGITKAINQFIAQYDVPDMKQNGFVQETIALFKLVV